MFFIPGGAVTKKKNAGKAKGVGRGAGQRSRVGPRTGQVSRGQLKRIRLFQMEVSLGPWLRDEIVFHVDVMKGSEGSRSTSVKKILKVRFASRGNV